MAIISQVKCPRCNSHQLYKFGKDLSGNQKYQCKLCKRQFTRHSGNYSAKNYPRCHRCGKATYLHHDYKYYSQYKCCDKKCNHIMKILKPTAIDQASCSTIREACSLKRMRFPLHVILTAMNMHFMCNVSLRNIRDFLRLSCNVRVSHVSISNWLRKFAPLFQAVSEKYMKCIDLRSDEWHADETVVKINGKKYYLWLVIDSETRFVISFHLAPHRDSAQAFSVLHHASSLDTPNSIVSDRYWAYDMAVEACFPGAEHIKVESFKDDISNNLIESFNDTIKTWYRAKRGFGSFESANRLIAGFIFFYNFIRPHSSLNGLSPAQVAGADYSDEAKSSWLLTA